MAWKRVVLDVVGVVAFCVAVAIVGGRCWKYLRPEDEPRHAVRSALADFQDVVYWPARAAMAGVNPYDARPAEAGGVYYARFPAGNSFPLYAPLIFVPSIPFAVLPLVTAELLYWFVNIGLLVVYTYVALRIAKAPTSVGAVFGLAAVLLMSRPGHANFYFGALALPLSLATLGAWQFADRRPWMSAVCLALSCIKPTFGGPLVVLMVLRGSYRAAFFGVAVAAIANMAVFGAFLPGEVFHPRPLELMAHNQAVIDDDPAVDPLKSVSRVDFPFVVERIWGRHFPGYVRFGITLAMLAVAGWQIRRLQGRGEGAAQLSLAIACLTIAICIYHNIYDALLVVIPAAAAWGALAGENLKANRRWLWVLAILFVVPGVHYLSSKQFLKLVAELMPAAEQVTSQPILWTLLCTLNGISLTIAWCVLLAAARREVARGEAAQPA